MNRLKCQYFEKTKRAMLVVGDFCEQSVNTSTAASIPAGLLDSPMDSVVYIENIYCQKYHSQSCGNIKHR